MASGGIRSRSRWNTLRTLISAIAQNGENRAPDPLGIEFLESRKLLSATFSSDPANPGKFSVSFLEDIAGTNDNLTLRLSGGQLQYKLNAAGFTNDLKSSAPGVQAL